MKKNDCIKLLTKVTRYLAVPMALFILSSFVPHGTCNELLRIQHPFQPDSSQLNQLTWLLGDWSRTSKNRTYGESWTQVSATAFEGQGYMVGTATSDTLVTEHLLLVAMGDDIFYIPKVSENIYPVPFRLVDSKDGKWVFENPQHDYPQRIEYERTAENELKVSISDMHRTQLIPFHFRKT